MADWSQDSDRGAASTDRQVLPTPKCTPADAERSGGALRRVLIVRRGWEEGAERVLPLGALASAALPALGQLRAQP